MITKYDQVLKIHKSAFEMQNPYELHILPSLLNNWGFKCREDDGELFWTNLSTPISVGDTFIIGFRYRKRDNSLTEDIFEISKNDPNKVVTYYKGMYQKVRPEYSGTHKAQDITNLSFTSVNTCSLYLGDLNNNH